jgi:hypothetical protein
VIAPARYAFGHTRVRAMKGALLRQAEVVTVPHRRDRPPAAPIAPVASLYRGFAACCATLCRSYPAHRDLFLAIFRLHELFNLKLSIRCVVRRRALPAGCWRPLDPLATLVEDDVGRIRTREGLLSAVGRTPYGAVTAAALRAHGDDMFAIELALDRWASGVLHEHAENLSSGERRASRLLRALVRLRDLEIVGRAISSYGVAPAAVPGLTTVLHRECGAAALAALAAWTPASGPLSGSVPRQLLRETGRVATWSDLSERLDADLRRDCRRSFVGPPFELAAPVALLVLHGAQIDAVASWSEAASAVAAARVLGAVPEA